MDLRRSRRLAGLEPTNTQDMLELKGVFSGVAQQMATEGGSVIPTAVSLALVAGIFLWSFLAGPQTRF